MFYIKYELYKGNFNFVHVIHKIIIDIKATWDICFYYCVIYLNPLTVLYCLDSYEGKIMINKAINFD
jgi:hypothetical protein